MAAKIRAPKPKEYGPEVPRRLIALGTKFGGEVHGAMVPVRLVANGFVPLSTGGRSACGHFRTFWTGQADKLAESSITCIKCRESLGI